MTKAGFCSGLNLQIGLLRLSSFIAFMRIISAWCVSAPSSADAEFYARERIAQRFPILIADRKTLSVDVVIFYGYDDISVYFKLNLKYECGMSIPRALYRLFNSHLKSPCLSRSMR
jgi:hypothetical protein